MEHRAGELRSLRREENFRLRLALQEDRQRPHMVEVRVGDDDRVHRPRLEKFVMRNRLRAFVFRVHPGVQHHLGGLGFEQIRIGADTGVATETFKDHDGQNRRKRADHGCQAGLCQPTRREGRLRIDSRINERARLANNLGCREINRSPGETPTLTLEKPPELPIRSRPSENFQTDREIYLARVLSDAHPHKSEADSSVGAKTG